MNILREIFYGSELTVEHDRLWSNNSSCTLNKWHPRKKPISISQDVVLYLIDNDILMEDSGNFETGEIHYVYDIKVGDNFDIRQDILELLKPSIREFRLNKIGI